MSFSFPRLSQSYLRFVSNWLKLSRTKRIAFGFFFSATTSIFYRTVYGGIKTYIKHPWDEVVMLTCDTLLLGSITVLITVIFQKKQQLRDQNKKLEKVAWKDRLTGVYSRHFIEEQKEFIESTVKRTEIPVTIAMLDLDDLKVINDTHGHSVGDALLKTTATNLLSCVRSSDTVARIGGDEFLILLYHRVGDCRIDCEAKIRERLGRFVFIKEVTASIGFSTLSSGMTFDEAMDIADKAMYREKSLKPKKDR